MHRGLPVLMSIKSVVFSSSESKFGASVNSTLARASEMARLCKVYLLSSNATRDAGVGMSSCLQKDLQAHGYTVVAFHPEVLRVSLFIFSQRMAWCVKMFTRYITITIMR